MCVLLDATHFQEPGRTGVLAAAFALARGGLLDLRKGPHSGDDSLSCFATKQIG